MQTFDVPGTKDMTLQIVNIDTVILSGVTHPTKRWLSPTGPASLDDADKEWKWIEATLKASKADWLIVAGHYPGNQPTCVYSYAYYSCFSSPYF